LNENPVQGVIARTYRANEHELQYPMRHHHDQLIKPP
jgi:hypothetical protein